MAQPGQTTIQLYSTTTTATTPSPSNLVSGELALNLTDKKLFTKDGSGNVIEMTPSPTNALAVGSGGTGATSAASARANLDALAATNPSYTGTLTGGTGVVNLGSGQLVKDAAGNLGLGVTPSAWGSGAKAIQMSGGVSLFSGTSGLGGVGNNVYSNPGTGDYYVANGYATRYYQYNGTHVWNTAPSGTAGDPISFTQAMTQTSAGLLLVGVTTPSVAGAHELRTSTTLGTAQLAVGPYGSTTFYAGDSGSPNAAATVITVLRNSSTTRSINAGGTINASGADYAEYERNNGLSIAKGSLVGFKADGTLTLTFTEAVRFAVKSTNPSYVGGDTWGSEDAVGARPVQPTRKADVTETTGEGDEAVATVIEAGDTDAEWQAKQDAYEADLALFNEALEAARQLVDRIAYSGKVPCNVQGATPGDYIVATAAADGSITGVSVTEPDFAQYRKAVGRVNRLLPDGRCEVAVIIH